MATITMVRGKKEFMMGMERNYGLIIFHTRANTRMGKNMDKDNTFKQIKANLKVNGSKVRFKDTVFINGQMALSMRATGRITKCMEKELSDGQSLSKPDQLERNTRVTLEITRKKGLVSYLCMMVRGTKEAGKMENSMESAKSYFKMERKRKENGNKESGSDGSKKKQNSKSERILAFKSHLFLKNHF